MKKILSTALVAIAFATVSTVDAKRMVRKGGKASVATVLEVSKSAEENPTRENKNELETALNEEANTEAKQETIDYAVRKDQLEDGIKLVQQRIKDLNYGWFGFGTDAETKKAHKAASDRLHDLKNELKDVNAKLAENKKETGSAWNSAVSYAIKTAKYIGIPVLVIGGISYDLYYQKGYTKGAMAEAKAGFPRTRAAAAKAYKTGKGYTSRAYEKLPSMRRGAPVTPEIPEPEYR